MSGVGSTQDGGHDPEGKPDEPRDPGFLHQIQTEAPIDLGDLVRAKIMATAALTDNVEKRAIGEHDFPILLAAFQKQHAGVQVVCGGGAGIGIALYTAARPEAERDPLGDQLEVHVTRTAQRFDWSPARELLTEVSELADEATRWLEDAKERQDLLGRLFGLASQLVTSVGRENRKAPKGQDDTEGASESLAHDCAVIRGRVDRLKEQFERDTQRAAQFQYARGMAIGAAVVGAIYGVTELILALQPLPAIHAIAFPAGAVGACVSVLRRMTRGRLVLNVQSGKKMLLTFGAVRPLVGGVFGLVIYLIIRAKLISIFELPADASAALAFVAFFGFVAGFNEQFAQDALANASNARLDDD